MVQGGGSPGLIFLNFLLTYQISEMIPKTSDDTNILNDNKG